jgi:ferrochelatase
LSPRAPTSNFPSTFHRAHDAMTTAPKTGIVLLNMGGPETLDDVEPFLRNLFLDRDILRIPGQRIIGPLIAKRRSPRIREQYAAIGGGSPIRRLTEWQGRAMAERLDRLSPETGPHRAYVAFRYTPPFAADALRAMAADGITRAVAFSQYPQFSCTTSGSSFKDLFAQAEALGLRHAFEWSVVDRWPTHGAYVQALAETVREGLSRFAEGPERDAVTVLFSAHSIPMSVVNRGDAYPAEVEATVAEVMAAAGVPNPWKLSWQSKVGPIPWLGPQTDDTITAMAASGVQDVLVVAAAFTTDHIETLFEIDVEYGHLAKEVGIRRFERAPALNERPAFADALATIVAEHLAEGAPHSTEYRRRCKACVDPKRCRPLPPQAAVPLRAASDEPREARVRAAAG